MKIYLLTSGQHEYCQVHGVFESVEDATRAKFLWGLDDPGDCTEIKELNTQTIPPLHIEDGMLPFTVSVPVNDECQIYVYQGWYARYSSDEGYTFSQESQRYKFYLFAMNEADAKSKGLAKAELLKL